MVAFFVVVWFVLVNHNRKEHFWAQLWSGGDFFTRVSRLSSAELSKHKRYEIRMSVFNAVGEGPSSPPQEVFVGEAGMHLSSPWGGLL